MFRDLARGHFVALGPALSRRPLPVVIGDVETEAQSTNPKLEPLPEAPLDAAALIFTASAEDVARPVRRAPKPVVTPTADLIAQLSRPREQVTQEGEGAPQMDPAEREARIDKVMQDVLEDPESGFRNVAVLYQDFLVRCRIQRIPGEPLALPAFRRRLAIGRARVAADVAAGAEWQQVLALSERLPDDVQSVFLAVAQEAISGGQCPPDATLARIYGTHSVSRARRLLAYFEERNLIVVRTDFHGRRVVAFPDLGIETAPGDPDAEDALSAA
jgi:uncharacterized protein